MPNLILFDDFSRDNLLPFTYTKPVAKLLIGAMSIQEKWEYELDCTGSHITQDYLSDKFPIEIAAENYVVNGSVLPNASLVKLIKQLENNTALLQDGELVAAKLEAEQFHKLMQEEEIDELIGIELEGTPLYKITHKWDLFLLNDIAIRADFERINSTIKTQAIPKHCTAINPKEIFVSKGVKIGHNVILDASNGPIIIGENAEIMHGSVIMGPYSMGSNSSLKVNSKVYGATSLGTHVRAGGEIKNSIISSYSNKGHEGYLGNSVIGEWCNLGADTNTSNMKNNYGNVNVWNMHTSEFEDSKQQFCGLMMGDHSKSGINTMFNTGTVVGIASNIFGAGMPPKNVDNFEWIGLPNKAVAHKLDKALETAERMMDRREVAFSEIDKKIWEHIQSSSEN